MIWTFKTKFFLTFYTFVPQLCPNRAHTMPILNLTILCPYYAFCPNCAPTVPQLELETCPYCAPTVPLVCLERLPTCLCLRSTQNYLGSCSQSLIDVENCYVLYSSCSSCGYIILLHHSYFYITPTRPEAEALRFLIAQSVFIFLVTLDNIVRFCLLSFKF